MIEITTAVGRLVTGHPMIAYPKKNNDGSPKMMRDGITPAVSFYGGLAIAKGQEQHWNQTEWGQKIWNEALSAFPNGETQAVAFAWKIEDGDSTIPNKKGKIPNQREGWKGHWIIHIANGFPFPCYHDGKFNPYESIQDKDEIKTGDYCQYIISVTGNNINGRMETDGMYLNPVAFNLIRAGVKIVSANEVDAQTAFGASNRQLPANALIDNSISPAPQPGVTAPAPQPGVTAPAPDFLTPPPQPGVTMPAPDFNVVINGQTHSAAALKVAGWNDDQIASLPRM